MARFSRSPAPRRPVVSGALIPCLLGLCALALAGCNVIEAVLGQHAKLTEMVAGGNLGTGELECWLTLEFASYPEGVDPRDVRVRFSSIALAQPAEFDWSFIADHDRKAAGTAFGSGYRSADDTNPSEPPPLGEPLKVKFPLSAKRVIENAPRTIWLKAELYWGDDRQDSLKRTLEHVYVSEPNGLF